MIVPNTQSTQKTGRFSRKGEDGVLRYYTTLLLPFHRWVLESAAKAQGIPASTLIQKLIENETESGAREVFDALPEEEKAKYRKGTVPASGRRAGDTPTPSIAEIPDKIKKPDARGYIGHSYYER